MHLDQLFYFNAQHDNNEFLQFVYYKLYIIFLVEIYDLDVK